MIRFQYELTWNSSQNTVGEVMGVLYEVIGVVKQQRFNSIDGALMILE